VRFTSALLGDATVRCWGYNNAQQLGNADVPPATCACSATPVMVTGLSGVQQISAGEVHACALVTGGVGLCWGSNLNGILGDGPPPPPVSAIPVIVNSDF
jgi:alpha-tubulin suppressor-like RCC1 family protein